LGSIGYVASSWSRVIVPNIVGLSTSAAASALSAVGLVLGSSTGTTTSGANSGNNGNLATQSVASGADVERGTTITYTTYYYYVAPPPPTPPTPPHPPPVGCNPPTGSPCVISYSCATVGCSFCCPDPCYKQGTINSSCGCSSPVGSYFC